MTRSKRIAAALLVGPPPAVPGAAAAQKLAGRAYLPMRLEQPDGVRPPSDGLTRVMADPDAEASAARVLGTDVPFGVEGVLPG